MLKTQITGAKYLSPQTNQMTNLNIAVPADSKDTEFGTSDILLAKDTAKLITDTKNTVMEGEKTTILAPTHIDSNVEFAKDINLADGELHIKVNFDRIDIPKDTFVHIMDVSNIHVYIKTIDDTDRLLIQFEDSNDEDFIEDAYIYDNQFEIIVRKNGDVRYMTGDTTYITEYKTVCHEQINQWIKLISFNTLVDKCSYTCEMFQYNFPTLKISQLDNDCNYIQQRNDDSLSTDYVAVKEIAIYNVNSINPDPKITFTDGIYDSGISICADVNGIYLPYETYISTTKDHYYYSVKTSLTDVAIHCMSPIYKIVNSLPTSDIDNRNIYMIKKTDPTDPNVKYDKYIYISEDKAWEKIG